MTTNSDTRSTTKQTLNLKDLLDVAWKLAAGLSITCYILGFIVVTIHLSQFGFYALSLIHLQYLLAGIWCLGPILLGWFLILYYISAEKTHLDLNNVTTTITVASLAGIISFLLLLFFPNWFSNCSIFDRVVALSTAGSFLGVCLLLVAWRATLAKQYLYQVKPAAGALILACLAAILFFMYITNFSRYLYGEIPSSWGGGKPRKVWVVPNNKKKEEVTAVGLPFPADSLLSQQVNLLLATEKDYIFLMGPSTSISIRSENIEAIIYEGQ